MIIRLFTGGPRPDATRVAVLVCCLTATLGIAQASAQGGTSGGHGWTLTPSLGVGGSWDDNVVLAGPERPSVDRQDYLTIVTPSGRLKRNSRWQSIDVDYRGAFLVYRTLDALNSYDQRARAEITQQVTRQLSLFARDSVARTPSTDEVDLEGATPFSRTGSRINELSSGVRMAFSARTSADMSYEYQIVHFDRDVIVNDVLRGGHAHGLSGRLRHELTSRLAVGGDYSLRHAVIADNTGTFDVQNGRLTADFALTPDMRLSGGFGVGRLNTDRLAEPRLGPSWQMALMRDGRRMIVDVHYRRSFVPSYSFGGTFRNQELGADTRIALFRNRAFWDTSFSLRNSDPLTGDTLGLRSIRFRSQVGYALQRWMRVEGFYHIAHQDTRRAGGTIDRNRIGFQIVTSKPLRIR